MGRLNIATRKKVIVLWRSGYPLKDIKRRLEEEEVEISLRSLQRLRLKFLVYHTIQDLAKAHRQRLLASSMMDATEESLRSDNEPTSRKLREILAGKFPNLPNVSLSTIKHCRKELRWVCTCPHYCQLVREANKQKRTDWCQVQGEV